MKKNSKDIILQKYGTVYRWCVIKYFTAIKNSESQAKFFSNLAMYCNRLVQESKCSRLRRLSSFKQREVDNPKLQQNFFRDTSKVLWRKNLVGSAYLWGYGGLAADKISSVLSGQQDEVVILNRDKLWSFLYEIELIIKKDDDFEPMSDKLKQLFQVYDLPFIES